MRYTMVHQLFDNLEFVYRYFPAFFRDYALQIKPAVVESLQMQLLHLQRKERYMQISKDIAAVSRYLRRQRNRYMAPLGLKSIHARLLLNILDCPGISQDGLAQKTGFDKSNIARQVAVLENAGFLSRSPSLNDKRVLELTPTEKTLALQPELLAAMEQWEENLLATLTDREIQQLTRLLGKLRAATGDEG
jgi:DNA-binding MarR family transcriptional regulator